ncbi:uncharacterized protein LOC144919290 isoform X1 [Branchiostoma floridae x Branchiostoma belcheri]
MKSTSLLAAAFSAFLCLAGCVQGQDWSLDKYPLQCPPCERIHCSPRKASKLKCKGGTTLGICNCCSVCAKVEGEKCGGKWDYLGKCDAGLTCEREPDSRGMLSRPDSKGICRRMIWPTPSSRVRESASTHRVQPADISTLSRSARSATPMTSGVSGGLGSVCGEWSVAETNTPVKWTPSMKSQEASGCVWCLGAPDPSMLCRTVQSPQSSLLQGLSCDHHQPTNFYSNNFEGIKTFQKHLCNNVLRIIGKVVHVWLIIFRKID